MPGVQGSGSISRGVDELVERKNERDSGKSELNQNFSLEFFSLNGLNP